MAYSSGRDEWLIDKQDVFALGCILHELLTGKIYNSVSQRVCYYGESRL